MILHHMRPDFRLDRLYAFSRMPGASYSAERAVSIDAKGLACLLNEVGQGYAQAAVAYYNIGALPGSPRAVAYAMPEDSHFFERGEGWHQLDFVAMPVRYLPGSVPREWQLFSHAPDGWAPAGMLLFRGRPGDPGQGVFVPPGHAIDFSSHATIQESLDQGIPLPGHIGVREVADARIWPELWDLVSEELGAHLGEPQREVMR